MFENFINTLQNDIFTCYDYSMKPNEKTQLDKNIYAASVRIFASLFMLVGCIQTFGGVATFLLRPLTVFSLGISVGSIAAGVALFALSHDIFVLSARSKQTCRNFVQAFQDIHEVLKAQNTKDTIIPSLLKGYVY